LFAAVLNGVYERGRVVTALRGLVAIADEFPGDDKPPSCCVVVLSADD
jgi:hypothetical protein